MLTRFYTGGKFMKTYASIGLLLFGLILWNGTTNAGESSGEDLYQQWIEYRDGKISISFNQMPVGFALYAIHAKTGFQIVIPSSGEIKLVNLKLDRQPFEPAMRSLISTIGYKNFALMYDQDGRPHRAVVLGVRPNMDDTTATTTKSEPAAEPLTADVRDKLQKDLERWSELTLEERGRIEDRLKNLAVSEEREELVREYGKQVLAMTK